MLETKILPRGVNALSIPGAVNKSNGRPLTLCFEHGFHRPRPSFVAPSADPCHPSRQIGFMSRLSRGEGDRRTDRERLLLPPELCQVDFEHPGSLDGRAAKRHVNRTSGFSLSQGQLLLALAPLAEGGRGANTHTGDIFYWVPQCPGEKLPKV